MQLGFAAPVALGPSGLLSNKLSASNVPRGAGVDGTIGIVARRPRTSGFSIVSHARVIAPVCSYTPIHGVPDHVADEDIVRGSAIRPRSAAVTTVSEESEVARGATVVPAPAMATWQGRAARVALRLIPLGVVVLACTNPAIAVGMAPIVAAWRGLELSGFTAGLTASFLLVLASEIGDKTFFISALLSMKYSRLLVLLGTMLALGTMTGISVMIGQVFHALPAGLKFSVPFDDYAAAALLLWFGFQSIRDGLSMNEHSAAEDELRDATEVVEGATSAVGAANNAGPSRMRIVTETTSLVFLAEWGDKSMLATVALAAAQSPMGVLVGGISGHFVASIIAVLGGSVLGKYISERSARLIGGVLFWAFAVLTIFNLF